MTLLIGIAIGYATSEFKHVIFKDGFLTAIRKRLPLRWGP